MKRTDKGITHYSLRFSDLAGSMKEVMVSPKIFDGAKEKGICFDGSSIEGFVRRYESDMRLIPTDISYKEGNAEIIFCEIRKGEEPYPRDPLNILGKTLGDAEKMGFNSYKTAAEPEFYLFKDTTPIDRAGYFDTSPMDKTNEVKKEVINALIELGIEWEMGHHEVGPGQVEVDIPYADALKTAANILLFKNVAQSVAQKFEITATFMPKPMEGQAGNGMHIHQSLWKDGENVFFDEKDEYQLSDVARYAIGGQLEHAKAIAAITNSTINSYKRLGEFEAPKYIYWGKMNRDALIRVPDFVGKKSARIEYRSPDPLCNPYLCFAVLLAATLDGIKRKINPPNPVEEDIYESGSYKKIETLPNNLAEALEELEDDKVIRGTLGGAYEPFVEIKRKEWEDYSMRSITDWERKMYF